MRLFKLSTLKKLFLLIAILIGAQFFMALFFTAKTYTIQKNQSGLESALANSPFVQPPTSSGLNASTHNTDLYIISFRTCPACIVFHQTHVQELSDDGITTKAILFLARDKDEGHPERAALAHLYQSRDWTFLDNWMKKSSPNQFYAANQALLGDIPILSRDELVREGQISVAKISNILADNGIKLATPALLWQNPQGQWQVAIGNSSATRRKIRADLLEQ